MLRPSSALVLLLALLLPLSGNAKPGSKESSESQRGVEFRAPLELKTVTIARHLRRDRALKRRFKKLFLRELRRLDVTPSAAYTLSASLVELRTNRHEGGVETRCVVSATVHQPGGALHAILRGNATVHTKEVDRQVELTAVESAIDGALQRVAEAVERPPGG